jgi:hypothetical protein
LLACAGWGGVLYGACGSRERPGNETGASSATVGATTGGFVSDGAHLCGNELHDALTEHPLIYLVIDRSGSMLALDEGETRYEKVRLATLELVDSLGALVRVGLTVFPAPEADQGNECLPGKEVFAPEVNPGAGFEDAIDQDPFGGTPIAATLQALRPKLMAEAQPRVILLATDGGPNCNAGASCGPSECIINIEGECPPNENCCEPPEGLVENCLDRQPTVDAIIALENEGTPVYVIGIPGSELFSVVLDQMALYGGVPLENQPQYYYRVDDLDQLGQTFKDIARELVSCTFDLADPPATQGLTNVYLDDQVVPLDPENGWVWVDEDTVELVGAACEALKDGQIESVQIVSGCPTETPQ